MAGISNAVLVESIRDILKGADLSSLSAKKVRQKLEKKFGADLTDRKKEIDKILMKLISEGEDEEEDDDSKQQQEDEDEGEDGEEDDEEKGGKSSNDDDRGHHSRLSAKNKSASNGLSDQSDQSEDNEQEQQHSDNSTEETELKPASPPKKKLRVTNSSKSKKPVKQTKDRHGGRKKEPELNDEQLAKKLQEEENTFRSRPRSVKKAPSAPKRERKQKDGKVRVSIYSKLCILSGELANVMGTDRMARKDVVKNMWILVKERKLEDPRNKQFMLCDEQLQRVFGRKRVRTFGMMKHLKNHIKDADD